MRVKKGKSMLHWWEIAVVNHKEHLLLQNMASVSPSILIEDLIK